MGSVPILAIVGRSIFDKFPFDPKVDAVTEATMSSSIVFEALGEGKDIFGEFKGHNFRSQYWKRVCFNNLCQIKRVIRACSILKSYLKSNSYKST